LALLFGVHRFVAARSLDAWLLPAPSAWLDVPRRAG
jgi:hypothetical protein